MFGICIQSLFQVFPPKGKSLLCHFSVQKPLMDFFLSQQHPYPFLQRRSWASSCYISTTYLPLTHSIPAMLKKILLFYFCIVLSSCKYQHGSFPYCLHIFPRMSAITGLNHSSVTLLSILIMLPLCISLVVHCVSLFSLHENGTWFCSVQCPLCLESSLSCSSHSGVVEWIYEWLTLYTLKCYLYSKCY